MKLTIEIEMGNSAFDGGWWNETARILHDLAGKIRQEESADFKLRDANGNPVGFSKLEGERAEPEDGGDGDGDGEPEDGPDDAQVEMLSYMVFHNGVKQMQDDNLSWPLTVRAPNAEAALAAARDLLMLELGSPKAVGAVQVQQCGKVSFVALDDKWPPAPPRDAAEDEHYDRLAEKDEAERAGERAVPDEGPF